MTDTYQLRLLGQLELITPTGASVGFATKKAAGLLAFLARQPGYRASRERLAALLWEGDASQAHQSLRSALSSLRKTTGPALLIGDSDGVALAKDKILIDTAEFEASVAEGSASIAALQHAAVLYRGDFLGGFTVRNAADFAEWAESERQRLRIIALEAFSTLMERLANDGASAETGIRAALQVLALDPFQERAHRALMRLHVRQGRHSAALKQYHLLSERLRTELGVSPEPATQELFQQITASRRTSSADTPKPVMAQSAIPDAEFSSISPMDRQAAPIPPAENSKSEWRKRGVIAGGVGIALFAGILAATWLTPQNSNAVRTTEIAQLSDKSVAVLPFANFSSEPDAGHFADGLTEELINNLAQLPDLKVPGRTSSFYFKGQNTDLREIGRKLDVSYVVEGSVRQSGRRLRVTAQLVSVKDGFHLWSKTYDRTLDDAFAIQSNIADDVAEALNLQLATRTKPQRPASVPKAYRTYLVAKAHLANRGLADLKTARTLYAGLMSADPRDANAHAGYAMATLMLAGHHLAIDPAEALRTAQLAIQRALRLNPLSADAHIAQGLYYKNRALYVTQPAYERDALQSFKRAVQLAPHDPRALARYGVQLAFLDQPATAIPYLEKSLALDPLDRSTQIYLGHAFKLLGRMDDALQQYRTVGELYPDFAPPKVEAARILIDQGKFDQAETLLKEALARDDAIGPYFELARVYATLGMAAELQAHLDRKVAPPDEKFAHALKLLLQRDYEALLKYAEANANQSPPSTWRELIVVSASLSGDVSKASQHLRTTIPGLFNAPPTLDAKAIEWAPLIANVLNRTGQETAAKQILSGVLTETTERAGKYQPMDVRITRVLALAESGAQESALRELQRAIALGYRTPINGETFIHISQHPSLSKLRNDPHFVVMLQQIDRDLARMRDAVRARHAQRAKL